MPISTFWLLEQRIIGVRDYGDITLTELRQTNADVIAMLDAGSAPVHLLLDLTALRKFPTLISASANTMSFLHHPALGYVAVWGIRNPILVPILKVIGRIVSVDPQIVDSLEQALRFIAD